MMRDEKLIENLNIMIEMTIDLDDKLSFVSQQDDEQTRKLMKTRIFEEIKKCTYRNVEKFFFKYFEKKD
jgi:hypothetical protein